MPSAATMASRMPWTSSSCSRTQGMYVPSFFLPQTAQALHGSMCRSRRLMTSCSHWPGIRGVELLERLLEHDAAVAVVAGAAIEPQEPHRHASRSSPCTAARRGRRAEGNRHARSRVREGNPTRRPPRARPRDRCGRAFTGPAQETLVPEVGLEPTRPFEAPDFESSASTSSATPARCSEQRFYTAASRSGTTAVRTGADPLQSLQAPPSCARSEGPRAARCSAADHGQRPPHTANGIARGYSERPVCTPAGSTGGDVPMPTDFACHCDHLSGSRALVTVAGELDLHSCSAFKRAIDAAARRAPVHLVLDLSAVSFMDSTALGVLAAEQRRRRRAAARGRARSAAAAHPPRDGLRPGLRDPRLGRGRPPRHGAAAGAERTAFLSPPSPGRRDTETAAGSS